MKFYLSLIIAFFSLLNINAQIFNRCFPIHVIVDKIEPNNNCNEHDGKIELHASGLNAPFLYKWEYKGEEISESRKLESLNGGDYNLTITSKHNSLCTKKKRVTIYGINYSKTSIKDCTNIFEIKEELKAPVVTGIEAIYTEEKNGEKGYSIEVYLSGSSNSNDVMFKEITDFELGRADIWIDVPKPGAILSKENFDPGKTYEFMGVNIYGDYLSEETYVTSKPYIYNESKKTQSSLLKSKQEMNNNFSVFPQPAKDHITIKSLSDLRANSVEILTVNGELIREIQASSSENFRSNVSDLDSGLYFLSINSGSQRCIEKIIIQ